MARHTNKSDLNLFTFFLLCVYNHKIPKNPLTQQAWIRTPGVASHRLQPVAPLIRDRIGHRGCRSLDAWSTLLERQLHRSCLSPYVSERRSRSRQPILHSPSSSGILRYQFSTRGVEPFSCRSSVDLAWTNPSFPSLCHQSSVCHSMYLSFHRNTVNNFHAKDKICVIRYVSIRSGCCRRTRRIRLHNIAHHCRILYNIIRS